MKFKLLFHREKVQSCSFNVKMSSSFVNITAPAASTLVSLVAATASSLPLFLLLLLLCSEATAVASWFLHNQTGR